MKAILLIFSFTLLSFYSQSQNHLVGAYVGLNRFNARPASGFNETTRGITPIMGLSYQYMINEKFSLGIDAAYDVRRFYNPITFQFTWQDPYNAEYRLNYLSMPLKAGYNFGNKIFGFVNLGAVPSYLLSGTATMPELFNRNGVISEQVLDLTATTKRLDISGIAELGGGLKFDSIWVYTCLAYQPGLMNINNSEDPLSSKVRLHGFLLSLGMRYVLN